MVHLIRGAGGGLTAFGQMAGAVVSEKDGVLIMVVDSDVIRIDGNNLVGFYDGVPISGVCTDITSDMASSITAAFGDDPRASVDRQFLEDAQEGLARESEELAAQRASEIARFGLCDTLLGSLDQLVEATFDSHASRDLTSTEIADFLAVLNRAVDRIDGPCGS